ncbi:hypothetical protein QBC38DRAFT_487887 [Podospora fimiseda]|uniref:Ecp2 effector protein-like domain-containing protein n=1 Tax=Podospora fimiseda TaxID=252190 RepID=A0AAN7BHJ4_9PEZI|nr:hypothetical protein QBC38DRAFT_487887 [Podospora fimiseda]
MQVFSQFFFAIIAPLVVAVSGLEVNLCTVVSVSNTTTDSMPLVSECWNLFDNINANDSYNVSDSTPREIESNSSTCVLTLKRSTGTSQGPAPGWNGDAKKDSVTYFTGLDIQEIIHQSIKKYTTTYKDGDHVGSRGQVLCDDGHNGTTALNFNLY